MVTKIFRTLGVFKRF